MKRAQAREIRASLLERNRATNDFHNVSAGQQFLDEGLGDRHAAIVSVTWRRLSGLTQSSSGADDAVLAGTFGKVHGLVGAANGEFCGFLWR